MALTNTFLPPYRFPTFRPKIHPFCDVQNGNLRIFLSHAKFPADPFRSETAKNRSEFFCPLHTPFSFVHRRFGWFRKTFQGADFHPSFPSRSFRDGIPLIPSVHSRKPSPYDESPPTGREMAPPTPLGLLLPQIMTCFRHPSFLD